MCCIISWRTSLQTVFLQVFVCDSNKWRRWHVDWTAVMCLRLTVRPSVADFPRSGLGVNAARRRHPSERRRRWPTTSARWFTWVMCVIYSDDIFAALYKWWLWALKYANIGYRALTLYAGKRQISRMTIDTGQSCFAVLWGENRRRRCACSICWSIAQWHPL